MDVVDILQSSVLSTAERMVLKTFLRELMQSKCATVNLQLYRQEKNKESFQTIDLMRGEAFDENLLKDIFITVLDESGWPNIQSYRGTRRKNAADYMARVM